MSGWPSSRDLWRVAILGFLLALTACAGPGIYRPGRAPFERNSTPALDECLRLIGRMDRTVSAAQVGDALAARIPEFPYLRVDRFLASFRDAEMSTAQFEGWVDALFELGRSARAIELANLEEHYVQQIATGRRRAELSSSLTTCATALRKHDVQQQGFEASLRSSAMKPPNYLMVRRLIGFYPLAALAVLHGIRSLHEEAKPTISLTAQAPPPAGARVFYEPEIKVSVPTDDRIAAIIQRSSDNPLGIPRPDGSDRALLFARFAPIWAVATLSDDDLIGHPYWLDSDNVGVDISEPVVFQRIAHSRYGDRIFLQLVYSIWFPARTAAGDFDLLAGHLDGMAWRVTLSELGQPILFDAMHNCGCYHMLFPTTHLQRRKPAGDFEEPVWIPQAAPEQRKGERILIYLAPRTHYIQGLDRGRAPPRAKRYRFGDDDELRSLIHPQGRRSLFDPRGMVPGTERPERFLLWPMGVFSPGAMRQWGTHATAFVGRRHFDDPDLIERYFEDVRRD